MISTVAKEYTAQGYLTITAIDNRSAELSLELATDVIDETLRNLVEADALFTLTARDHSVEGSGQEFTATASITVTADDDKRAEAALQRATEAIDDTMSCMSDINVVFSLARNDYRVENATEV